MAADKDSYKITDWYNAQPYRGIRAESFNTTNMTVFYNAQPYGFIYPSKGITSNYFFMMM